MSDPTPPNVRRDEFVDHARLVKLHRTGFTMPAKAALLAAAVGLLAITVVVPQGDTADGLWGEGGYDPETGEYEFRHDPQPAFEWGMVLGILAGYLLLVSPLLAYKWPVRAFLPPRWRTRLHVGAGILLLLLAIAHAVVLFAIRAYESWPSGLASLLILTAHGLSGAYKTRLVPRWGARRWRTLHVGGAWLGLAAGLVHSLAL